MSTNRVVRSSLYMQGPCVSTRIHVLQSLVRKQLLYKLMCSFSTASPVINVSTASHLSLRSCALRLRDGALVVCAPPCSMMGAAASSVHQRSDARPYGNQQSMKTRLSNRVWTNMVTGTLWPKDTFWIALNLFLDICAPNSGKHWKASARFIKYIVAALGMIMSNTSLCKELA